MCYKTLTFQVNFHSKRSAILIIGFNGFSIACYAVIFCGYGAVGTFSSALNETRYVLWVAADFRGPIEIVNLMIHTLLPFATEVVLFFCVLVMTSALMKAKKFRETSTSVSGRSMETSEIDNSGKLSGKELQIVRQVLLIAMMFMVCSSPKI